MNSNNLSLTTLSENPEYFEEVIKLIEEGFHYSESHHYEKDFAPLVDPLNFENCFIYIDKENSQSFMLLIRGRKVWSLLS